MNKRIQEHNSFIHRRQQRYRSWWISLLRINCSPQRVQWQLQFNWFVIDVRTPRVTGRLFVDSKTICKHARETEKLFMKSCVIGSRQHVTGSLWGCIRFIQLWYHLSTYKNANKISVQYMYTLYNDYNIIINGTTILLVCVYKITELFPLSQQHMPEHGFCENCVDLLISS